MRCSGDKCLSPERHRQSQSPHPLRGFTKAMPPSYRYEEELSLRPCAENEFVTLKKVRWCLGEQRSWTPALDQLHLHRNRD